MSKWLGYTVELFFDGQWYNIDQWHRHANGQLRHHFLYTAPERDILSSAHDELALSRERICFSDLAAETQEQIELLKTLKCDRLQGYLIGKPMPADDFFAQFHPDSKRIAFPVKH